jgi:hypothetical protein
LGAQGLNAPANVVVSPSVEANFSYDAGTLAAFKRWYYYGPDVPDAAEVAAPYASEVSPKKRWFNVARRASDLADDGIQLSPSGNPFME